MYRQYVGQEQQAVSMASGVLSDKTLALTARGSLFLINYLSKLAILGAPPKEGQTLAILGAPTDA